MDLLDSMAERSSSGETDISAGCGRRKNLLSLGTGFSRGGAGRPWNWSARESRLYRVISMNIRPVGCIDRVLDFSRINNTKYPSRKLFASRLPQNGILSRP